MVVVVELVEVVVGEEEDKEERDLKKERRVEQEGGVRNSWKEEKKTPIVHLSSLYSCCYHKQPCIQTSS